MSDTVAVREQQIPQELSVKDVVGQVRKIQEIMEAVMKNGDHYGTIPGTKKPTLLKPGAEKLILTFRLCPEYEVLETLRREGFLHYGVRCILTHIPTSNRIATGLGSCNTGEKKYRNVTVADVDNTILKMACKRALVAAVLNGTAASDIFTQDMEDAPAESKPEPEAPQQPKPAETDWRPKFLAAWDGLKAEKDPDGKVGLAVLGEYGHEHRGQVPTREEAQKVYAEYLKRTAAPKQGSLV